MGIPGFCHIKLQGGCAASSHRRFGKEVKTAYEAFVQTFCPGRAKVGLSKWNEVPGVGRSRRIDGRETLWVSLERCAFAGTNPSIAADGYDAISLWAQN